VLDADCSHRSDGFRWQVRHRLAARQERRRIDVSTLRRGSGVPLQPVRVSS